MTFSKIRLLPGLLVLVFSTGLCAQIDWLDYYNEAMQAISESDWESADQNLGEALKLKRKATFEAETYALQVITYTPYYWRGIVYFNLGRYEESVSYLTQSENWGAIKKTPQYETLKATRERARAILGLQRRADSLQTRLAGDAAESAVLKRAATLLEDLNRALQAGNGQAAGAALRELQQIPEAASLYAVGLALQSAAREANAKPVAEPNPVEIRFRQGLDNFVAGDYNAALRIFRSLQNEGSPLPGLNNWINRTLSEINNSNSPPQTPVVERDTVLQTVEPFLVLNPYPETVRRDVVVLTGSVRDDQGIRYIEFSLNGSIHTLPNGDTLRIAPPDSQSVRGFDFSVSLPLRLGENTIIASVYDLDRDPHSSLRNLALKRLPPIYRTPIFWGSIILVLAMLLGGWGFNNWQKRRIAFVNKYNPYIAGAPVRNEKLFFGREELLKRILNTLHSNSLMLHGPRRIGKTSLLHQLRRRLMEDQDDQFYFVPVYIDLQGTPEERFFRVMMEDIAEGCESYLQRKPDLRVFEGKGPYSPRDFNNDIRQLLDLLRPLSEKTLKLTMLIDEVDQLNTYSDHANQKLRSIFMKTFAENLVSVMSGSQLKKHWESEGSPWYNFFEEIPVGGIDRDHARGLITEPVSGIYRYDEAAIERILLESDCIPYRIQKICVNVIARLIHEQRRRVTEADVEAVLEAALAGIET